MAITSLNQIAFPNADAQRIIMGIANGATKFPKNGTNGIILHGEFGTGKSACAKLIPQAIENNHSNSAADPRIEECRAPNNGVELLEGLETTAKSVPFGKYRYFVLDEIDNITPTAMKQFKSLMNIPDTIFVMTTNYLSNVDKGIRGRSYKVNYNPSGPNVWLPYIKAAANSRGIQMSNRELVDLIMASGNNIRESLAAVEELPVPVV